jgi:hypothetical protein
MLQAGASMSKWASKLLAISAGPKNCELAQQIQEINQELSNNGPEAVLYRLSAKRPPAGARFYPQGQREAVTAFLKAQMMAAYLQAAGAKPFKALTRCNFIQPGNDIVMAADLNGIGIFHFVECKKAGINLDMKPTTLTDAHAQNMKYILKFFTFEELRDGGKRMCAFQPFSGPSSADRTTAMIERCTVHGEQIEPFTGCCYG